jgi:RNA polymerase sigma factor (sigma-70 family)
MSDTPPDADISAMQRLAAGDDLALNSLMERWKDKVAAFLMRMTGNAATATDLAQETFVKLYQSRARYRPTAPFPTYLFRIAANLARNHARWKLRHPTVSIDNEDDHVPESVEAQPGPAEQMERSEQLQRVEMLLQHSTQPHHENETHPIHHHYSHGRQHPGARLLPGHRHHQERRLLPHQGGDLQQVPHRHVQIPLGLLGSG